MKVKGDSSERVKQEGGGEMDRAPERHTWNFNESHHFVCSFKQHLRQCCDGGFAVSDSLLKGQQGRATLKNNPTSSAISVGNTA